MKTKTLISTAAATSILAAAMMTVSAPALAGAKSERCAGVVKAGKNGCEANGHGCAGQAAVDNDPNEWVKVPTGTCGNIVSICTAKAAAPEGVSEKKIAKVCGKIAEQTDVAVTGGKVVEKAS
ncbi:MAG: BufA1 family periplasmic bufferin-type metallophore [Arenicella sp.]